MVRGRKWLVHFNTEKNQLVLCDQSNNTGSIYVKMDGSVLEENSSFKMFGFSLSSKLDRGSYIIAIAKITSKRLQALICSLKFLSPEYKSVIQPCMKYCCHIWDGVLGFKMLD